MEAVGDTWSPTASMRTLKYLLADAAKHKARLHQLDFIGAFLQAKVKNRVLSSWTLGIQIISRICTVLWKSLDIVIVHVWYDYLWEVFF